MVIGLCAEVWEWAGQLGPQGLLCRAEGTQELETWGLKGQQERQAQNTLHIYLSVHLFLPRYLRLH